MSPTGSASRGRRTDALTRDGRCLYATDANGGRAYGWWVAPEGGMELIGWWGGLPATVAGLAAS